MSAAQTTAVYMRIDLRTAQRAEAVGDAGRRADLAAAKDAQDLDAAERGTAELLERMLAR